jgi:hypothetical protein
MNDEPEPTPPAPSGKVSLAAGGWVILLALILALAILAWQLIPVLRAGGSRAVGDGRNVETYGFDLTTCLIPRDQIIAAHMPKDGLQPLDDPPTMPGRDVAARNEEMRGKYLVPSDRVIGVKLNGQARAYPLRFLNLHEIVNDTLGDVPIAVTYSPLCDAAVVFDRRVGDEILSFGHSGLLYNSNLLMYDRRPDAVGESLWCQLLRRAIAGPATAAEHRLDILPAALLQWGDWLELHPDTDVLAIEEGRLRRYKKASYTGYFGSDELRFPVDPLPPTNGPPNKTPVLAVLLADQRRVYTLDAIAARADINSQWRTTIADTPLTFFYRDDPPTAWADSPSPDLRTVSAFWFAWHAMHPDDTLVP